MAEKVSKDAKEAYTMPTIELLDCEKAAYVKRMKNYLQKLKALPNSEAIKRSMINLQNSNIIEVNREYTDRNIYSEKYYKKGVDHVQ